MWRKEGNRQQKGKLGIYQRERSKTKLFIITSKLTLWEMRKKKKKVKQGEVVRKIFSGVKS